MSMNNQLSVLPSDISFEKEDKILRTKYDIEQEFKDLKFIHQHPVLDNSTTIYNQHYFNGLFKRNLLFTLKDDLFINFDHEVIIPQNLNHFWSIYEKERDRANIILDSRMINYIAYAVLRYEDDVLVYDVYASQTLTVYVFCSKFFNIQTNEITIHLIKQLFIAYLLFVVYVKQFNFEWNISLLLKYIKTNESKLNEQHMTLNIFDILINCAKVKSTTDIRSKNVYKVVSYFEKYFSEEAFDSSTSEGIDIYSEWKLNNVKDYEFLIALTVLKNNNFVIKYIE